MTTPQERKTVDGAGGVTPQSVSHTDRFATSRPRPTQGATDPTKEPRSNA